MSTNLTGMNRETYTIPADSIKTISYNDVNPNYFHIQNNGTGAVYFSAHGIPTKKLYDMKVDGGSISTFTDPYPQAEVYIYNPSMEDINIIISSFRAPFDPAVLAQSNRQISIAGSVETDGVVKGFETELPTGSNKIGKVDVENTVNAKVTNALPSGSNKIGKVDVSNTVTVADMSAVKSSVADIDAKITTLNTKIEELKTVTSNLAITSAGIPEVNWTPKGGYASRNFSPGSSLSVYLKASNGKKFKKIVYVTSRLLSTAMGYELPPISVTISFKDSNNNWYNILNIPIEYPLNFYLDSVSSDIVELAIEYDITNFNAPDYDEYMEQDDRIKYDLNVLVLEG